MSSGWLISVGSPAPAGIDLGYVFVGLLKPRFPRTRGDRPWLMSEGERTIHVKSKAIYKQGIWGNGRVQRIGVDGKLYKEAEAE